MDVNAPEFTSLAAQFSEATIADQSVQEMMMHQAADMMMPPADLATYQQQLANYRPDYIHLNSIVADAGSGQPAALPVTSLTFDSYEELLWQGNAGGHVTSYYGSTMNKYTSFQVHQTDDIRQLLSVEGGLLALTKNSLQMYIRRGLRMFTHNSDLLKDMQCLRRLSSGLLIMGGHQKELIEFDIQRQTKVRVTEIEDEGCVIIRNHPKLICCGDAAGKITLRDPSTLNTQHAFTTHSGMLSDFDVRGNHLVTCGFSIRDGAYIADRFLMVFDLRMMRATNPIRMEYAPYLLRFVPLYSSKFCVVSQSGKFQLLDTSGNNIIPPPYLHDLQLPMGSSIVSMDVSSSSQALAFGDSMGYIHLTGGSNEIIFNNFNQPTEFADEPERVPSITMDDYMTPYSIVPMPVNYPPGERLLSDWPPEFCQKVHRIPRPIDPEILENMHSKGSVGYVPNPRKTKRNQCVYDLNPPPDDGKEEENGLNFDGSNSPSPTNTNN